MSNISENLNALMQDGRDIKAKIIERGGTSSGSFDTFSSDIDTIPDGGGSGGGYSESGFYLNKIILSADEGYIVERTPIVPGQVVNLGVGEDSPASTGWGEYYHATSHPEMNFQSWSCPIPLNGNTFTIPSDISTDYYVGGVYATADNLNWIVRWDSEQGFFVESNADTNFVYSNNDPNTYAIWLRQGVTQATLDIDHSLRSISIPNSLTSLPDGFLSGRFNIIYIVIPEGTTNVPSNFCADLFSLKAVVFPSTLTSISDSAFSQCYGLKSISLPDTVKSLGYYSFSNNESLINSNIPSSLELLSFATFNYNYSMNFLVFPQTTPPTIEPGEGFTIYANTTLLVPVGTVEAYTAATQYTGVTTIVENTEANRKKYGLK